MKIEIKNRFTSQVLFSGEYASMKLAVEAAIKVKTDLSGSDLSGSDLRWSDLSGSNLSGSDLSGSNLRGSDLSIGVKLNWSSHQLISEILFRASGNDQAKRSLSGLIRISTDWCWNDFQKLKLSPSVRKWAIKELKPWVLEGDDIPEILK